MALSVVRAIPGAPPNVHEAVEAAHKRLHRSRCQGWMVATGRRPISPYSVLNGTGQVVTVRVAEPKPREGCELHPIENGDL